MKTTKFSMIVAKDDKTTEETHKPTISESSKRPSVALAHKTPYERMMLETEKILATRNQMKHYEKIDNQMIDVTPKLLEVPSEKVKILDVTKRYSGMKAEDSDLNSFKSYTSTIIRQKASKVMGLNLSLDDIIEGIGPDRIVLDVSTRASTDSWQKTNQDFLALTEPLDATSTITASCRKPFIRIILRKTELKLLYEHRSVTAAKNTEEGNFVENDNRAYDYLTIGKGKIRRRSESETQTFQTLNKSRAVNTHALKTSDAACFVSNYEMYDTFKMLNDISVEGEPTKLRIPKSKTSEEQFASIAELPAFKWATVVIKRLLAGNTYEKGQRRFRNMQRIRKTVNKIDFKYSVKTLFTIYPMDREKERMAVADMSFCYTNGDILAVAYGIYSYKAAKLPTIGQVGIWSIKNPCDPERFYNYTKPVVTVEFSPFLPSLLAIGLFDGSIEVRNITNYNQAPVAVLKHSTNPIAEPILAIIWIKEIASTDEIDPFLALSQNGSVTQCRIIKSPYLACFKIMSLDKLEGLPEGLPGILPAIETTIYSNRCPQGLNIIKHPTQLDVYYILTDEGCLYKCSTNYHSHYIKALRAHEGSVNHMDFSPWSPQLFLTCGNDWCIRIWISGIFQPLITLQNACVPYNWAAWSRTNSTILVAVNQLQCEIWDLGRNVLKPVSTTEFNTSYNTLGIYSLDGNSILIGKERGEVLVNALDDMPFAPHYQYDYLEKAIYKAVSNYPDLLIEFKSFGYFGYPNEGFVK